MVEENGQLNDEESTSALMMHCIDEGRIDVLRSILSQLAAKPDFHEQVDSLCCQDGTLLHYAVAEGSVDSVRTLLSSGVNPCVQNDLNQTAYQTATSEDIRAAFVQELLQATAHSNLGRVCQMLSSGVHVDSVDGPKTGNTALHWAATFGNEDIVRILCESGATVNVANAKGETPLHDAVKRGDNEIVRRLLLHGADASRKDRNGVDCYELAAKAGGAVLQTLSMNTVTRAVRRSASLDSEVDRSSIISSETTTLFVDKTSSYSSGRIESWTDLLWPQPKYVNIDSRNRTTQFPKDDRLKIYFDGASHGEPRRLMQVIQISAPLLSSINLELEYRGHKLTEHSGLDGKVTCGLFNVGGGSGAYTLSIADNGIELFANDYSGIRYGFATLVQILRIHRNGVTALNNNLTNGTLQSQSPSVSTTDVPQNEFIPCLTIRDSPDMTVRAVFQDFSGCKILNTETLLQLATRIGYCKASHLFVNFEVRTTDRYQLPYTNRDLFRMTQVCDELFVKLVPSLDLQSNYIEPNAARRIIECFLDDFPLSKVAHFGANIASILITNRTILDGIQRRVPNIYISLEVDEKNASAVNQLPPYVTLCVEGRYPFDAEKFLSPKLNVVLRFTTSDPGYLCSDPESIAKKAILTAKLGDKFPILGSMICDLSTGCEVMPASMSYISEVAGIGISWNNSVDMKRFCFLLPRITAEHILLDGNMEPLFKQATTLGRVEHEITKFSYGLLKPSSGDFEKDLALQPSIGKKTPISVFVEMILNPDNMTLERLTPVIFKKARIELRRSLKALEETRKRLPYNFELALVLAEIQLVTELMVLASRLGQSLCTHGANPGLAAGSGFMAAQRKDSTTMAPLLGYQVVNVGVANLPLTIRTDLANNLLDIRAKFQHTWLSRNIASTLPNALKIFDNLFRALLPPNLQDFGKNLL